MARSAVVLLFILSSTLCAAHHDGQLQRIPRIIHRNFMGGAAALQAAALGPQAEFKAHWLASCTVHHPGWQEVLWDEAAVLQLMQDDFPWFLQTYLSYTRRVQRSDVMRYMVLYKYGGVYLDADIECYTNMEQSLQGQDLVLSCEDPGPRGQLHNAAMASVAGHPIWLSALQLAMQRSPAGIAESSSWVMRQALHLWQQTPLYNGMLEVLRTTGPLLLTDVYRAYTAGAPTCGYTVTVAGSVSTAYPVGSWFTPCVCWDTECTRRWNAQHFELLAQQQRGDAPPYVPVWGIWLKPKLLHIKEWWWRLRWQVQQQQARDTASRVHVEELPASRRVVVGIHQYSSTWTDGDHTRSLLEQQQARQQMSEHVLEYFRSSPAFLQHAHAAAPAPPPAASAAPPAPSADAAAYVDPDMLPHLESTLGAAVGSDCAAVAVLHASAAASDGVQVEPASITSSNNSSDCRTGSCFAGPAAKAAAASAASIQQQRADLHPERLLQQLGCKVITVTPDGHAVPAWKSVDHATPGSVSSHAAVHASHNSSQSGGGSPAGALGPVQGSVGQALRQPQVLALPALLEQSVSGNSHARHVLHFACDGCELAALQELFANPWDTSSAADSARVVFIDVTMPQPLRSTHNHSSSTCRAADMVGSPYSCVGDVQHDEHSSSLGVDVIGWDAMFNLLHQQLGFKGFWRQELGSNILRLGWVREPVNTASALQSPFTGAAAGILRASSAQTPQPEVVHRVCDCCQACCGGPAGSSSSSGGQRAPRCPLWQRVACQVFGSAVSARKCKLLTAGSPGGSSSSAVQRPANAEGCKSGAGCSPGCCACWLSLMGLFRALLELHASGGNTSSSPIGSGLDYSAEIRMAASCAVVVVTATILAVRRALQARRTAAKLQGFQVPD